MITLGDRIRLVRKLNGLTMEALAKKISDRTVSKTNKGVVSNWENKGVIPRESNLDAIIKIFDLPPAFFSEENTLGNTLLYYRLSKRMSIQDLEIKTELDGNYIRFIEEESAFIKESDIDSIGRVYGIPNFLEHLKEKEEITIPININEMKESLWEHYYKEDKGMSFFKEFSPEEQLSHCKDMASSVNKNINLRHSKSEYYIYLSNDTSWLDEKTSKLLSTMDVEDVDLLRVLKYAENVYWNGETMNHEKRIEIRKIISKIVDGGLTSFDSIPPLWGDLTDEEEIEHLKKHAPYLFKEDENKEE